MTFTKPGRLSFGKSKRKDSRIQPSRTVGGIQCQRAKSSCSQCASWLCPWLPVHSPRGELRCIWNSSFYQPCFAPSRETWPVLLLSESLQPRSHVQDYSAPGRQTSVSLPRQEAWTRIRYPEAYYRHMLQVWHPVALRRGLAWSLCTIRPPFWP